MTVTTDQDVIGSKLPAKNGYGQNGYGGASSDLPGKHTKVPKFGPGDADPNPGDWQTRDVSTEAYPTHPGMKARGDGGKVPGKVDHAPRR